MRQKLLIFCLVCTTLLPARPNYAYFIRLSQDLKRVFVKIEIRKTRPLVFTSGTSDGKYYIENIRVKSKNGKWKLDTYDGLFYPGNISLPATISYEVDLTVPSEDINRLKQSVVIDPGVYFWRPAYMDDADSLVIHLQLPAGMHASVPWAPLPNGAYLYQATPPDWPGFSAFGRFDVYTVNSAGVALHIANPRTNMPVSPKKMKRWLKQAAASVAGVYGRFPIKDIQVLLIPIGHSREAVPFAQVVRNGGVCVEFFIDASRPLKEFITDWTATHELSHSLLPFVIREQAWLSEGMATYYQYILMARDGRLTPQQAWTRILKGFKRGIAGADGKSLQQTAADMSAVHSFRNVYWSGAAMMLRADVRLRRISNNNFSLDDVLARIQPFLKGSQAEWSGMEMMQLFDRFSGTTVFMDIYNRYVPSGRFPVDAAFLKDLGIIEDENGVHLNNNAPNAGIRRALLSPHGGRRPRAAGQR